MAKWLMFISYIIFSVIAFINLPKPFLLIVIPILIIIISFLRRKLMPKKENLKILKKDLKKKKYDLNAAIKGAAEKIVEHPEVLLWR